MTNKDLFTMVQPKDIVNTSFAQFDEDTFMTKLNQELLNETVYDETLQDMTPFNFEIVRDWDKRISKYPDRTKAIYKMCREKMEYAR